MPEESDEQHELSQ